MDELACSLGKTAGKKNVIAAAQKRVGTGHFEEEDEKRTRIKTSEDHRRIHQQDCLDQEGN